MAQRNPDLSGQRFGRLVATKRVAEPSRSVRYHVRCDCGAEKVVQAHHLRSGATRSCGCIRAPRADLTGRRVGRLTVTEPAPHSRDGRTMWRCRCDCGTVSVAYTVALNAEAVLSCGCLKIDKLSARRGEVRTGSGPVSYEGAHRRVRVARGPASAYGCVDCSGPARDWSYDHLDPDELTTPDGYAMTYSLAVEHYQPRCRSCHSAYDSDKGACLVERR